MTFQIMRQFSRIGPSRHSQTEWGSSRGSADKTAMMAKKEGES
jgi:hypothetical protein